jgi:hypothetical protein
MRVRLEPIAVDAGAAAADRPESIRCNTIDCVVILSIKTVSHKSEECLEVRLREWHWINWLQNILRFLMLYYSMLLC